MKKYVEFAAFVSIVASSVSALADSMPIKDGHWSLVALSAIELTAFVGGCIAFAKVGGVIGGRNAV